VKAFGTNPLFLQRTHDEKKELVAYVSLNMKPNLPKLTIWYSGLTLIYVCAQFLLSKTRKRRSYSHCELWRLV